MGIKREWLAWKRIVPWKRIVKPLKMLVKIKPRKEIDTGNAGKSKEKSKRAKKN